MGLIPREEDVAIVLAVLIFFLTIPSARSLAAGKWRVKIPNHDRALYEDEDGVASTESQAKFSNKLQFILIFAFAVIGLGLSIADAIFTAVQDMSSTASTKSRLVVLFLLVPSWVTPIDPRKMLHANSESRYW